MNDPENQCVNEESKMVFFLLIIYLWRGSH